ncbi:MAG: sodium:proton antiporter, partial [bacterium]
GVLVAMGITALLVAFIGRGFGLAPGIDLKVGLVFGALVAATDPVAVTALFRELKAPARLATLVESESLFNDGTGVVFLSLVLAYVTGATTSVGGVLVQFVFVVGGGVLVGLAVGLAVSMIIRRVDEPMIEIGLTVIAAYGSFVLAEGIHASGVLGTVIAGMMCGRQGRDLGMSHVSREAVQTFWEYIAFALNSIVFLLVGFQFDALRLRPIAVLLAVAFAAMLLARAAVVFGLLHLQRGAERLPLNWGAVISLGGLRGALSIVLALALPDTLPARDLLVSMTVGVVLLSIIVQGLSMPVLMGKLRLREDG